eukprot:COSAG01_NODE_6609_length_3582_cov_2.302613_2_plen_286_part_00
MAWLKEQIANMEAASDDEDGQEIENDESRQQQDQVVEEEDEEEDQDDEEEEEQDGDEDEEGEEDEESGDSASGEESEDEESAPSGPEQALQLLKRRYKRFKGRFPSGPLANNMGWLKTQVEALMSAGAAPVAAEPRVARKVPAGSVQALKKRYRKLKGAAPRGSKANNAQWLSAQIADMEARAGRTTVSETSGKKATKRARQEQPADSASGSMKKKNKQAAAAAVAAGVGAQQLGESDGGDGQDVVGVLKERYRALKGGAPRGPKANDPAWLRSKIAEMMASSKQ